MVNLKATSKTFFVDMTKVTCSSKMLKKVEKGYISYVNDEKGYGFIVMTKEYKRRVGPLTQEEKEASIFFHYSAVQGDGVVRGDQVEFQVWSATRGKNAKFVTGGSRPNLEKSEKKVGYVQNWQRDKNYGFIRGCESKKTHYFNIANVASPGLRKQIDDGLQIVNACVEFRVGGPDNNAFFVDVLSKQESSGETESKDAITGAGEELQLLKEKVDDFMRTSEKMEIDLASVRSQVATLTMEKRDLQVENEGLKNQLAHAKQRRYDNLKKLRQRLKERKESRRAVIQNGDETSTSCSSGVAVDRSRDGEVESAREKGRLPCMNPMRIFVAENIASAYEKMEAAGGYDRKKLALVMEQKWDELDDETRKKYANRAAAQKVDLGGMHEEEDFLCSQD